MLISKIEKVLKRMRWRTLEFTGKLEASSDKETYGFRSLKCPPTVAELSNFENDLMLMAKNIEFRKISNNFQKKIIIISELLYLSIPISICNLINIKLK